MLSRIFHGVNLSFFTSIAIINYNEKVYFGLALKILSLIIMHRLSAW